jgi:hypothetical protein
MVAWCSLPVAVGTSSAWAEDKPWTLNAAPSSTPTPPADKPVDKPAAKAERPSGKPGTVDQIKGIGKFNLGQNFTEFPPTLLRVVDPRASGILLRVSPYGENYLVTDVSGMTWGGIPIQGMVLTFHGGVLIDIQVALKAKKFDLYAADRAFKTKYGPNDPKAFPVETWRGNQTQMTLIFPDATTLTDALSLDTLTDGKIDLFDLGQWNKIEAARASALKDVIEKRYQDVASKVQADL